ARASVRLCGSGALTIARIARSDIVTLVERGAHHGACSDACSRLACVRLRARAIVVARHPIGLGRIRALTIARIACADVVTLVERSANYVAPPGAQHCLAAVGLRARASVVTRHTVCLGWVRADARGSVAG